MRRSSYLLALCGLSLLSAVAKADTFTYTASALGITESGTLSATSNGDGSYIATAMTGQDITGLLAPGTTFFNDNLIFPGATRLVDVDGLGFSLLVGGQSYQANLFSNQNGFELLAFDPAGNLTDAPATFTLSAPATVTPEPSSLLLLASGALGMGATALRRRKQQIA